ALSERAALPGPGDGEGDARALDVHEQPVAVKCRTRPLPVREAAEVAREPLRRAREDRVEGVEIALDQLDAVLGEAERAALEVEPDQALRIAAAVLAQQEPAARAERDVVGSVEAGGVGGFIDERELLPQRVVGPDLA